MASLLSELLHDVCRRAGEIEKEFSRLKGVISADVEDYRQRMASRAEKARQLAEDILADPDLAHPALAVNFFRDFRDIARLVLALEHLPLLVLRRFNEHDGSMTKLCRQICREIGYPHKAPICSSLSSQYYWTMPDMDLVFVPSLEPERLLGLADIYHELGHIILFRAERIFIIPGLVEVDRHFDGVLHQGRQAGWGQQSLQETECFRGQWRAAWFLEFASDLIATYLAGPAFGWCNIRTSTNLGGELFQGNESHPADDARAFAIGLMLDRLGAIQAAADIRTRWQELLTLAGETQPPRYDMAYPHTLLQRICDLIYAGCQQIGLVPWKETAGSEIVVGRALDAAWTEFRLRPETFEGFEVRSLTDVLSKCQA